jgi:hypothetical protein
LTLGLKLLLIKSLFFKTNNTTSKSEAEPVNEEEGGGGVGERKQSVESEYNLELPDDDDLQPLTDFNEKSLLTKYTDDTYGCVVLVRQPFRSPNLLYKNALQKMTEVRTWTECLVKLVDGNTSEQTATRKMISKKLIFFNLHELVTLATELEKTLEQIINEHTRNDMLSSMPAKGFESEEVSSAAAASEANQNNDDVNQHTIRPFHEIDLKASHKFTDMCLQQFDTYTKIHTFKLQEIVFKEAITMRPDRLMALPERFFKRFTKPKASSLIDHTPIPFEICKFAHMNYAHLHSFLLLLQDAFWALPTVTRKIQREQQLEQLHLMGAAGATGGGGGGASGSVLLPTSITSAAATLFSFGKNAQIVTPTLSSVTSSHAREEITVKVLIHDS